METQVVNIEKLPKLFENLDGNTVKSLVAFKQGDTPLVHLVTIPHPLMDKVWSILKAFDVKTEFVEVVQSDFGDLEPIQKA